MIKRWFEILTPKEGTHICFLKSPQPSKLFGGLINVTCREITKDVLITYMTVTTAIHIPRAATVRDCLPPGQTVNLKELNQLKMETKSLYVFACLCPLKHFFLFSQFYFRIMYQRENQRQYELRADTVSEVQGMDLCHQNAPR